MELKVRVCLLYHCLLETYVLIETLPQWQWYTQDVHYVIATQLNPFHHSARRKNKRNGCVAFHVRVSFLAAHESSQHKTVLWKRLFMNSTPPPFLLNSYSCTLILSYQMNIHCARPCLHDSLTSWFCVINEVGLYYESALGCLNLSPPPPPPTHPTTYTEEQ